MKARAALMLTVWLAAAATLSAAPVQLREFRRMAVMDQGRLKPLDTFARNLLKQFSGRARPEGIDACEWLSRVLFAPGASAADAVFLVRQPELLDAIGVTNRGRGRYTHAQLRPGLRRLHELAFRGSSRDEKDLDRVEFEALRLFYNLSAYHGLLHAFAFALGGESAAGGAGGASSLPAVIPLAGDRWLSPGRALAGGTPLPAMVQAEISLLATAARAYGRNDPAAFDRALAGFNRSIRGRQGPDTPRPWKISLEVLYNRANPFFMAGLAYGLALLFLLLAMACRCSPVTRMAAWSVAAGFLAHTLGIAARMLISGRPPVTNLYETFVFVAWTAAALGLVAARLQKRGPGLAAGALAAAALLSVSGRHALEGDTMGMLTAVLDSNLWLATHVVTIALGYGGCVVAGIIGHVLIIQAVRGRNDAVAGTARLLYAVLAFGLVFTVIGTLMGGIWADQSWGRFWGWDPKENGALLIIAWCAALFHSRLAGWIGPVGLAAGAVGSLVTVALAWFGVNLLGLGLHAYGFTSGAMRGLLAFLAVELVFLAVAVPLARKRIRA